MRIKDK